MNIAKHFDSTNGRKAHRGSYATRQLAERFAEAKGIPADINWTLAQRTDGRWIIIAIVKPDQGYMIFPLASNGVCVVS